MVITFSALTKDKLRQTSRLVIDRPKVASMRDNDIATLKADIEVKGRLLFNRTPLCRARPPPAILKVSDGVLK